VAPRTRETEGLRDLLRWRDDLRGARTATRHRVAKHLLRHGRIYREGKHAWTIKHRDWVAPPAARRSPRARRARADARARGQHRAPASDAGRPAKSPISAIWQAQLRLYHRHRHLSGARQALDRREHRRRPQAIRVPVGRDDRSAPPPGGAAYAPSHPRTPTWGRGTDAKPGGPSNLSMRSRPAPIVRGSSRPRTLSCGADPRNLRVTVVVASASVARPHRPPP
jgi:hypothetical protein